MYTTLNKKTYGFKLTIIFIGELPKDTYKFANPTAFGSTYSFFTFIHFKDILE